MYLLDTFIYELQDTETESRVLESNETKDEVVRVPAVLPLPGLGSFSFLTNLTTKAGPNAFDSDAIGLVLDVMWSSGIRKYFLIDFFFFIVFFTLWVILLEVSLENVETGNVMTITSSVIALNTLFFFEEMIQSNFFMSRNHFRMYVYIIILSCSFVVSFF